MAKKTMTAQECQAIDWAALLAKLPAFAALLAQLIALLNQPNVKACDKAKAKASAVACCQELKDACDVECDTLAQLILDHCALHDLIHDCDKP